MILKVINKLNFIKRINYLLYNFYIICFIINTDNIKIYKLIIMKIILLTQLLLMSLFVYY